MSHSNMTDTLQFVNINSDAFDIDEVQDIFKDNGKCIICYLFVGFKWKIISKVKDSLKFKNSK